MFHDEVMSVTNAAKIILGKLGINKKTVQGSIYWEYQGEILFDMRKRIELE